ncbi:phage/plasmid replication protein, II/X family [Acinetobacter sp. VNK23]|uniref:phage/plasmid replication protein, II/X family n=1 Tax=Acinetobacter thutiue TaxID=2998078 RepID=UPI0025767465|nr:phage/plasmid replication protein, II/X family [Acinetobacter thutiue]MDM1020353.1 phage/plasmid replication protein, II/X family [Acinetobacter thutiue]
MQNNNEFHIDWLDVIVDITHDPKKLSDGLIIYLNKDLDYDKAQQSYRSKLIESENKHKLKVKSINGKLKISGNFYKWLYGQNITGCTSVIDLVLDVVNKFIEMHLVEPTDEQLETIKKGQYRIFQVHIKKDIVFNNEKMALDYLERIQKDGDYPYRKKTIYQNGVYFGQSSKRWVLGYYHKGKEIKQAKWNKCICMPKEKALADMMIRAEIKIYPKQLTTWDLKFAWQWKDIYGIFSLFEQRLCKLRLPSFNNMVELENIMNNADKKFYTCLLTGEIDDLYSSSTIYRKKKKFMQDYNINIDNINNKKLKGDVCKN